MVEPEKRISDKVVDIDYEATRRFFERRADRPADTCAWTRVMYQDDDPELVIARDSHEKQTVLPQLKLHPSQRVLDVGCGVGRWALATAPLVEQYLGTDFSEGLLNRARDDLREHPNVEFQCLPAQNIGSLASGHELFDRVILAGILSYLNDDDVERCLQGIAKLCSATDAIVYIREPMGVASRLTLDRYWSDQLESEYSAIYRSREQYRLLLQRTLCAEGFEISRFSPLYPRDLENRLETSQFIVLLQRGEA